MLKVLYRTSLQIR